MPKLSDRLIERLDRRPAGNSARFWARIEDDDPFRAPIVAKPTSPVRPVASPPKATLPPKEPAPAAPAAPVPPVAPLDRRPPRLPHPRGKGAAPPPRPRPTTRHFGRKPDSPLPPRRNIDEVLEMLGELEVAAARHRAGLEDPKAKERVRLGRPAKVRRGSADGGEGTKE